MVTATEELNSKIKRWLSRGGPAPLPSPELAAACDRILRSELAVSARSALKLATRFVDRARQSRDAKLQRVAVRALARTLHVSGKHRDALRHYTRARKLALDAGDRLGGARIDRALADVYMYLNRYREAEATCRRAIRSFQRLDAKVDAVQTEVNLANLYHRQDRHRDAARVYARAEAFFAGSEDALSYARVLYNHANTLVQMFLWDSAGEKYRAAESIYREHEFTLDANDASYGLAYIHLLADRFAAALSELTQCERVYQEGGDPRGVALCVLDLAEAYLGLNLYEESLASARTALTRFTKLKLRYEAAKARLYLAYAYAGLKRTALARRYAQQALRAFEAERNRGMVAAARLLLAQLVRKPGERRKSLAHARQHFSRAQLPIWSTLCDLQLFAESSPPPGVAARLARQQSFRRVPHWSALYDSLRGERSLAAGRLGDARRHWRRAAETLEKARAELPPLELRTAYLSARVEPYQRLITLDAVKDPLAAAGWAERLKTAGIWSPTGTLEAEDSEARRLRAEWHALSSQLAAVARQVHPMSGNRGLVATQAEQSMRALERKGNRLMTQLEARSLSLDTSAASIAEELRALSRRIPAVLWHCGRTDIYAFVIDGGEARTHIWPDGSERLALEMRRWRFLMERHMIAGDSSRQQKLDSAEQRFWAELGDWLWRPLELEGRGDRETLIIPDGALFALPFGALRVSGEWLADRIRPVVAPSLRHYQAARSATAPAGGIEIHDAGGEGLEAVAQEVDSLVELLNGADYALRRPAQRSQVLGLNSVRLWHFAGHARFRADNPFYSTLQLSDGPVFAAELRARRIPLDLVTLSACHSAGGSGAPGEEYAGLVRSILEMGARSAVAALWPVSDQSTAAWMSAFYKEWLGGMRLTEAIRSAQQLNRERWPSPYHWSAFALYGTEI